ncbi:MAG: hypothetical protein AAFX99_22965 [Myxococcota bacterium]
MFCRTCHTPWPGHTTCPECGGALVDLQRLVGQTHIERLPQFEDLARQFELGRKERLAEGALYDDDSGDPHAD